MAGEEDDYMGDLSRFITDSKPRPAPASKNAVSGQSTSKGKAKQRWQDKRKESRDRSRKSESEKLSEALDCAIPPSNIGFKMLQQMGYKPGEALGKHGQGALEPLKVELKRSRTGLGVDEIQRQTKAKHSRQLELQQELREKLGDITQKDFLDRQRSSWHAGKIFRDYKKARSALAQLDDDRTSPEPEADAGDGDKEPEEEEVIKEEDLQRILEELRSRFFYCIYCGCKYDSASQLESSCPGLDEDSH